jgi:hypothetical protein
MVGELSLVVFKTEMNVEAIKSKVGTMDIKLDRLENELETVKQATLENSRDIIEQSDEVKVEYYKDPFGELKAISIVDMNLAND